MAQLTLADLLQHQAFTKYINQQMLAKSTVLKSGIALEAAAQDNK